MMTELSRDWKPAILLVENSLVSEASDGTSWPFLQLFCFLEIETSCSKDGDKILKEREKIVKPLYASLGISMHTNTLAPRWKNLTYMEEMGEQTLSHDEKMQNHNEMGMNTGGWRFGEIFTFN